MKTHPLRIVTCPPHNGITKTQGTEVWAGDVKIDGVIGVTLSASPDDVWRATIIVIMPPPPSLHVLAEVKYVEESLFVHAWRKLWRKKRDVTTFDAHSRELKE